MPEPTRMVNAPLHGHGYNGVSLASFCKV